MYTNTLTHCCGMVEIGEFDSAETPEQILQTIKEHLEDCVFCDYETEYPRAWIATTKSPYQDKTAASLKSLGFVGKKFQSRHATGKEKELTLWTYMGIPKELRPWVRQRVKEIRKDNNDNW